MRRAFLRRRAGDSAPVRAGVGRAGPAAQRRRAAGPSLLTYLLPIDPDRPGPLYAEAIACTERSGDDLNNSILHDNAVVTALEAGDLPAARAHLEAAGQAAQQIGWESATLRADLGSVLRAERDLNGARSTFEAVLRIGQLRSTFTSGTPPRPQTPM